MSRKISHSLISGRAGAGTGGQGLKIDWFKTNLGRLLWRDVSESVLEWYLGGTNYGYCAGGYNNPNGNSNQICKWSLSSDADATDVGNLTRTVSTGQVSGCSSSTHGYASGGIRSGVEWYDVIEKWTFASDADATDVGDLGANRSGMAGVSSADYGFYMAGQTDSDADVNIIEKFTFASDGNASDVGDTTVARRQPSGCSSATHGYACGGYNSGYSNVIDKVSISAGGNATDVGDLENTSQGPSCSSSTTHGYVAGGIGSGDVHLNKIQKFSFESDANATDIGDLNNSISTPECGVSSTTHGYCAGGRLSSGAASIDVIDKYSFASDGNASDIGNLVVDVYSSAGAQY